MDKMQQQMEEKRYLKNRKVNRKKSYFFSLAST